MRLWGVGVRAGREREREKREESRESE